MITEHLLVLVSFYPLDKILILFTLKSDSLEFLNDIIIKHFCT